MANRAYLYTHTSETFPEHLPDNYYDSRHTIPIGWFFFFDTPHVRMDSVQDWQELKCVASKSRAIELYESRRLQLEPYLIDELLHECADRIVFDVRRHPGDLLLLDPSEVFGGGPDADEVHLDRFLKIVDALNTTDTSELQRHLRAYCNELSGDPERRLCQVFGYTYS